MAECKGHSVGWSKLVANPLCVRTLYKLAKLYVEALSYDNMLLEAGRKTFTPVGPLLTHGWVEMPVKRLCEILNTEHSDKQLRRALEFLVQDSWLIRQRRGGHPMDKTWSYRINNDKLAELDFGDVDEFVTLLGKEVSEDV